MPNANKFNVVKTCIHIVVLNIHYCLKATHGNHFNI